MPPYLPVKPVKQDDEKIKSSDKTSSMFSGSPKHSLSHSELELPFAINDDDINPFPLESSNTSDDVKPPFVNPSCLKNAEHSQTDTFGLNSVAHDDIGKFYESLFAKYEPLSSEDKLQTSPFITRHEYPTTVNTHRLRSHIYTLNHNLPSSNQEPLPFAVHEHEHTNFIDKIMNPPKLKLFESTNSISLDTIKKDLDELRCFGASLDKKGDSEE